MDCKPLTESEVGQFVRDWFGKLDKHSPVEEMLPFLADEKLVMKMPDREEPFRCYEGFKEWYKGIEKYVDQVHTIKGLWITPAQDTAKVEIVVQWQATDSSVLCAERRQRCHYAAQTWELERSPHTQSLVLVRYSIDYYVPEFHAPIDEGNRRTIYQELCNSYRAIDDFRSKLLGFLPLASGTGIFLLLTDLTKIDKEFLLPVGIFGFLITLGLYCYEIYGIRKCGALIDAGKKIEVSMNIEDGQFKQRPREVVCFINEPFAAGIIYAAVLAAWTYILADNCQTTQWYASGSVFIGFFAVTLFYNLYLKGKGEIKKCINSLLLQKHTYLRGE